jgi:predicted O-methyltransferase YrrM
MSLLHSAAMWIPAIRRLHDSRDALRVERDVLVTRIAQTALEAQESTEERLARNEGRLIITEYPYYPHSRPMEDAAGGRLLQKRFRAEHDRYAATMQDIARYLDFLLRISRDERNSVAPFWANGWFPPLDAASLYGLIAERSPRRYIEVGSGISTRFARQAIRDGELPTQIVSIDPHPHTAVDLLCDEKIRSRMEDVPRDFWEGTSPNDLLFIDNSHRSFPNSDVTVFFAEVLPALKPGTIWGLHDILLPWDYPEAWRARFYNEQYLLLAYLLGGADGDEVILPARWVSSQPLLHNILAPLWAQEHLFRDIGTHGGCFWMRRRPTVAPDKSVQGVEDRFRQ